MGHGCNRRAYPYSGTHGVKSVDDRRFLDAGGDPDAAIGPDESAEATASELPLMSDVADRRNDANGKANVGAAERSAPASATPYRRSGSALSTIADRRSDFQRTHASVDRRSGLSPADAFRPADSARSEVATSPKTAPDPDQSRASETGRNACRGCITRRPQQRLNRTLGIRLTARDSVLLLRHAHPATSRADSGKNVVS